MDTTEHEVVKEPGDGSVPPGGNGPPPVSHGDGAPTEERSPRLFREQLLSIVAASALVLVVVWVSFEFGYRTEKGEHVVPSLPSEFLVSIIVVLVAGLIASFGGDFRDALVKVATRRKEVKGKQPPEWLLGALVYLLTCVVVFALISLVTRTDGFIDSPFTPLMTAPAAIGPFMARSKSTIGLLSVFGIASVWLSLYVIDESTLGLQAESWVLGLMASAMLLIAGVLSYVRHKLEDDQYEMGDA